MLIMVKGAREEFEGFYSINAQGDLGTAGGGGARAFPEGKAAQAPPPRFFRARSRFKQNKSCSFSVFYTSLTLYPLHRHQRAARFPPFIHRNKMAAARRAGKRA